MSNYRKARQNIEVTVGESVRIIRELQELEFHHAFKRLKLYFTPLRIAGKKMIDIIFFVKIWFSVSYC